MSLKRSALPRTRRVKKRPSADEETVCLAAWGPSVGGTAASFGVYAFSLSLGPTSIIDSIRTSMWHQEVFGSA